MAGMFKGITGSFTLTTTKGHKTVFDINGVCKNVNSIRELPGYVSGLVREATAMATAEEAEREEALSKREAALVDREAAFAKKSDKK